MERKAKMEKYGYKEVRRLYSDALRRLCITMNWYTEGSCDEYANLLNMCDKENITTDDIVEIAADIMKHSSDGTERPLTSYAFEVARTCVTFIEEYTERSE